MNVTIEKVTFIENECCVSFSSELGSARALWGCAAPDIGESYDVEVEIMDEVVWGVNAHRALSEAYSISYADSCINLTGRLMSIEADGVAVFDLNGSVVLVEVLGCPEPLPLFISIKLNRVSLFSTGI